MNDDEYAHLAEIWSGVSSDDFEETTVQSAAYAFARGLAASADIAGPVGEDFNRESGLMTGRPSAFVDDIKARLKLYHGTLKSLFPVPGEVDHIHVFRDIALKGNFDSRLKEQIGAYRDFSLMLCHPGTNEIIGGTDFVVYIHKDGPPTAQANFTFLKSQYRGLKFARKLLDARAEAALKFIRETDPAALRRANGFYWFVEQNRPEAMGALSYVRDIAYSLDPIERLKIWAKFGFARLDCRYDQPALGPNEDPCRILSLNTSFRRVNEGSDGTFELGAAERPECVAAAIVYNHLDAFFTQSIAAVPNDPTANEVLGSGLN